MDCCTKENKKDFDLVIIGSGSAAFAGAIQAVENGASVLIVERGTLGGSCVNVGCVPSKTLIRVAEAKYHAENQRFKGLESSPVPVSFETIMQEKNDLVSTLRKAKYEAVLDSYDGITFLKGDAVFISDHEIHVGDRSITGNRFLIATGSSPYIPPISGLNNVDYLTSSTALELKSLPASMIILGGRYIALELAQMFQRMGTEVTILQRNNRILPTEDPDLTDELTKHLTNEGMKIITGATHRLVLRDRDFKVTFERKNNVQTVSAGQLVAATGRKPNIYGLNLETIGIKLNDDKSIQVNEYGQTSISHIYAAGDVIGEPAFVYTAAYEGNLAAKNAITGNSKIRSYTALPSVVFTDPQVARVGLNESQTKDKNIEVDVSKLAMENVPRAIAARDTRGFIKLIKKKGADHLIGASILAPEGSELLMEVALAIKYNIPVSEIAGLFHPYLTLGEAVKLACQTFNKDVKKLSCCAS